jgi:glycosyltransferase involved in cell wall biosynthesis
MSDIVSAGRLLKHKNVHLILKAVALLKNKSKIIKAIIIGNGPEKKRLIKLTEKLQIQNQIEFIDFLPKHAQAISIIKSSKVFVFPSEREGFGLVAIEANACGIPFITSNHFENAAQYLIENNNGSTFDLTEESLAKAIEKQLNNLQDKEVYMSVARKYDWEKSMKELIHLYAV